MGSATTTQPTQSALGRWLDDHGITNNPFSAESYQAETDPMLKKMDTSVFIDPPNPVFENLVGSLDAPGYRFIWAVAGGGKSSLRLRIKSELNIRQGIERRQYPRFLAVEYINPQARNLQSHMTDLANLIGDEIKDPSITQRIKDFSKPKQTLEQIADHCRHTKNLDGLCVLVDEIDVEQAESLLNPELLNIPGVSFKFMLPLEKWNEIWHKLPFMGKYESYVIEWDAERLRDILVHRVSAVCRIEEKDSYEDFQSIAESVLSGLCEYGIGTEIVQRFIDIGLLGLNPRAMWRFGYQVLQEHSSMHPHLLKNDLISNYSLNIAKLKVKSILPELPQNISKHQPVLDAHRDRATSAYKSTVVAILREEVPQPIGTGFLIFNREQYWAITCAHVLRNTATDTNGRIFLQPLNNELHRLEAQIEWLGCPENVGADFWTADQDIAIMRVISPLDPSLNPLPLDRHDSGQYQEKLQCFGYPKSLRARGDWILEIECGQEVAQGFVKLALWNGSIDNGVSGAPVISMQQPTLGIIGMIQARDAREIGEQGSGKLIREGVAYLTPAKYLLKAIENYLK